MKKFSKLVIAFSVIFFSHLFVPFNSFAQGPNDPGVDPDAPIDAGTFDAADAPIDGNIVLLMAAGLIYGIKKRRNEKLKSTINLMDSIH